MNNGYPTIAKTAIIITLILCFSNLGLAQSSQAYHVDNIVRVNRTYCSSLSKLSVLIPCPTTNQYQTISHVNHYGGTLLTDEYTQNKYVRFLFSSTQLSGLADIFDLNVSFKAVLHPFTFDFSQIDAIYPYNTSSPEYYKNIGPANVFIVPNNPTINTIAEELWSNSSDIVDYARRCYEYVAFHFLYLNPNTGLHPLSQLLDNGGGDCANLSSIYISLLRNKSIPSRHVVTIRPDGSQHVWAEFYLEHYGWIPVDVTYKQSDPFGDYFGIYDGNGIVVSKGICFSLEKTPGDSYQCILFQNYEWWYWHSNSNLCSNITTRHIVNSSFLDADEIQYQNAFVFPNPTYGLVTLTSDNIKEVKVFNTLGIMVKRIPVNAKENTEIDLSDLPNGVYLLQIQNDHQNITKQIVKI